MPPKFNRRRALFVLTKIDEILAWEQRKETERDTKFVELGRYLCEVRVGQYWRLERLKCFDEFLERRFPESWRKAYYLMSIHEYLNNVSVDRWPSDGTHAERYSSFVARCHAHKGDSWITPYHRLAAPHASSDTTALPKRNGASLRRRLCLGSRWRSWLGPAAPN
jgi:hypothetical protein